MDAVPEAEMATDVRAPDVEDVRLLEDLRVAVRTQQRQAHLLNAGIVPPPRRPASANRGGAISTGPSKRTTSSTAAAASPGSVAQRLPLPGCASSARSPLTIT